MAKMSCANCAHCATCKYTEEYVIFLDETMKEPFDLMPDFLDIYIHCKYYTVDSPIPRNFSTGE